MLGEKGVMVTTGIEGPSWTVAPSMGTHGSPRVVRVEKTKENVRGLEDLTSFQQF